MISNKPVKLWKHEVKLDRFFKRIDCDLDENSRFVEDDLAAFQLEEININDLVVNEVYINIDGHSLKCIYKDDNELKFDWVARSPLNIYKGVNILDLEYGDQWNLFWILTKNEELHGLFGG